MSNNYFRFKQFTIQQDRCVQKVCTDACILGAWFAGKVPVGSKMLDIGSGSGLLTLMLAQKIFSDIQGIEIDSGSYRQQLENFAASKWKERLSVFEGDVRHFSFPEKFDFIISNPPFFENDRLSSSEQKNIAKHGKELTFEDLIKVISQNLNPNGSFGILLPYNRTKYFEELALKYNFFTLEKLMIRQSPKHSYFRSILHLSGRRKSNIAIFELMIQNRQGEYDSEFIELMKEYYLNL